MSEPIYKQVQRDLEGRANGGKEQYGDHLTADTKIDGLQYLYEELLDGSNYIRKAMEDRERLWAYCDRMKAAMKKVNDLASHALAEPTTDTEMLVGICTVYEELIAADPRDGAAPASPWRPIAEAPESWLYVGRWDGGKWYERSTNKERAIAEGYTHYYLIGEPPAPPEVK